MLPEVNPTGEMQELLEVEANLIEQLSSRENEIKYFDYSIEHLDADECATVLDYLQEDIGNALVTSLSSTENYTVPLFSYDLLSDFERENPDIDIEFRLSSGPESNLNKRGYLLAFEYPNVVYYGDSLVDPKARLNAYVQGLDVYSATYEEALAHELRHYIFQHHFEESNYFHLLQEGFALATSSAAFDKDLDSILILSRLSSSEISPLTKPELVLRTKFTDAFLACQALGKDEIGLLNYLNEKCKTPARNATYYDDGYEYASNEDLVSAIYEYLGTTENGAEEALDKFKLSKRISSMKFRLNTLDSYYKNT